MRTENSAKAGEKMASTALAVIAFCLIFGGRLPLYGGRILRGSKARLLGALILPFAVGGVFVPGVIGICVAGIPLTTLVTVFFLAKGEEPTANEAKWLPFASPAEGPNPALRAFGFLVLFLVVLVATVAVLAAVLRLVLRL